MHKDDKLSDKIKKHKKEIIIGCATIVAVVGGIVIYQKTEGFNDFISKIKTDEVISKVSIEETVENELITKTFPVKGHVRNIGNNSPSPSKIVEALENNIVLKEHQTYVNAHNRTLMVA